MLETVYVIPAFTFLLILILNWLLKLFNDFYMKGWNFLVLGVL